MGEGVRDDAQDSSCDDGVQGGQPRVAGGTGNVGFTAQRSGTHPGQGLSTVCVSGVHQSSSAAFPAPVGRLLAQNLQAEASSEAELLESQSPSIVTGLTSWALTFLSIKRGG